MIKLVSIIQAYIVREANSFDKSTIKKKKSQGHESAKYDI